MLHFVCRKVDFLTHESLIFVHESLFFVHESPIFVHESLFFVHESLFFVHESPIFVHESLFFVHESPIFVHESHEFLQKSGFVPPPNFRRANNLSDSRSESSPLGRRGWERKPTVFFPKRSFSFDRLGGG
jgi:hypothetical protein